MGAHRPNRRGFLQLAGVAVVGALAGCGDGGSDSGEPSGDEDGSGGDGGENSDGETAEGGEESASESNGSGEDSGSDGTTETATSGDEATATPTATPESDGLDLREANVVGVEFEGGDGVYDFDVTLHHDDDGEEGYANWWQVERLDGTQLGRRELLHPHSRQPFTRSETIDVPAGVTCVVVRGHDQTHGYGGRAVLVNLASGARRGVAQGSEPQSFAESDCP